MTQFSILGIFVLSTLSSSAFGNVLAPRDVEGCGGSIFVEDAVVIDAPLSANCKWQIKTDENRVLVFTVVSAGGNFKQVEEFLSIHDGLGLDSSVLLFENQKVHEVSKKELPEAIYTTGSVAEVRFKKTPTSVFKLKIQKAVNCPFNLGAESQCGRVVDETSCYCATFTKRDQTSQTSYCDSNAMKLWAIESYEEEFAIQTVWGTSNTMWTSGSDEQMEGKWIWETTGSNLYPGYANWADGQPDNLGQEGTENCLHINGSRNGRVGWNNLPCSNLLDAICEAHS
ncbi:uncharacterized protein LOC124336388 isoform X2 [Daphnia pulicaria]|uniref:uncharacterized protein LOC124336388 isoform X2 n=1 Tax=Daphnia pulicaria TaxID=35523 RepID=UPI001EEBD94B|nr:uncharacterized protein LOC124336388 isoform X2 [Daphnia pulicaria]